MTNGCSAISNLVLLLVPGVILVSSADQGNCQVFPDAAGSGRATAGARFAKATIIPGVDLPKETMSPDLARFKVDLDALLTPHDMTWGGELPGHWYDGAPLGNGDMGVIVYGYPEDLHIVLGKTDAWDRRNDEFDVGHLPGKDYNTFRQTYFDDDGEAHQRMIADAAKARRQKTLGLPHLTSCGRLQLHFDGGIRITGTRMRVSLKDGLMTLTYLDRTIQVLVSREYDVSMVDIDRGKPETDPSDPVLANRYGSRAPFEELPWEFWRPALEGNDQAKCTSDGLFHFATQRFRAGGHYTVGITFNAFEGCESVTLPGAYLATCRISTGGDARCT